MTNRIIILFSLIFCSLTVFAAKKYKISQDSLLKMFSESDNILETFTSDVWWDLDKKDLDKNDSLKPYFLRLLDADEFVFSEAKKRASYSLTDTTFSEKMIRNDRPKRSTYSSTYSKALEKHLLNHSPEQIDSILANEALLKVCRDSVKKEFIDKAVAYVKRKGLNGVITTAVKNLHKYLKYPEAYTIIKEEWKKQPDDNELYNLLLYFQDPEIMEIEFNNVDCTNRKEMEYISWRYREKDFGIYSIDFWLKMLTCDARYFTTQDIVGIDVYNEFPCPYNISIFLMYEDWLLYKCKFYDDIVSKLYVFDKEFIEYKFIDYETSPIYKMSYKQLQEISKEISEHVDEIAEALKPYRDEIEKKDNGWRSKMPYYDRIKIQK